MTFASAGVYQYYPDEDGNREKVPLIPLIVVSVIMFVVELCAIIAIELKA